MKRRDVLRSVGVASTGLAGVDLAGADGTDQSSAQINSPSPDVVESQQLSETEAEDLISEIETDDDVQQLINKADNMGWSPDWSSIQGVRYTTDINSVRSQYDVVTVPFEKDSEPESPDIILYGDSSTDEEESLEDEELVLRWAGNDSIQDRERFRAHTDGATTVQKAIDQRAVRTEMVHLKKRSDSDLNYSVTGPVADELTAYVASDNISEVMTFEQETVEVDDNGVRSISAEPQTGIDRRKVGVCAGDEVGPQCGGGGSGRCENVPMDVYERYSDCTSLRCLLLSSVGAAITGISCVASFGLLCLVSAGVSYVTIADCYSCSIQRQIRVNISEWALEKRIAKAQNGIDEGDIVNACEAFDEWFNNSELGQMGYGMPVTECELEDLPTEEDYNYPGC